MSRATKGDRIKSQEIESWTETFRESSEEDLGSWLKSWPKQVAEDNT